MTDCDLFFKRPVPIRQRLRVSIVYLEKDDVISLETIGINKKYDFSRMDKLIKVMVCGALKNILLKYIHAHMHVERKS